MVLSYGTCDVSYDNEINGLQSYEFTIIMYKKIFANYQLLNPVNCLLDDMHSHVLLF